jgi:IstB-like ATP binding protein
MLVESRMRGNVHVRFGGRKRGNGAGVTRPPRLLPTQHLPIDRHGANLFFQLVSRRYERGSIILTSNQSLGAWGEVFGDAVIASAILDRLLHHSITVNIKGESFRLKEKLRAGLLKPKLDGPSVDLSSAPG